MRPVEAHPDHTLYMAPNSDVRTVVGLFKFRRRTHTCLNQTGASSAPEFEKRDHGADISVRRMAGALGWEVLKSTLRGGRRQLLPRTTTPASGKPRTKILEGVGPCLAVYPALSI